MKDLLNRLKADVIFSAVLCIMVGIIVMVWPDAVTLLLGRVIGIVLFVMGLRHIIQYLSDRSGNRFGMASGVVIFALGALILIRPSIVAQMVAVVVGVLLIMHGMEDMKLAIEAKEYEDDRWWISFLFALLTMLFGIFVIWQYFQMAEVAAWLLGAALVYDGLSNLVVVFRVTHAAKEMKRHSEIIDVEATEEDE